MIIACSVRVVQSLDRGFHNAQQTQLKSGLELSPLMGSQTVANTAQPIILQSNSIHFLGPRVPLACWMSRKSAKVVL